MTSDDSGQIQIRHLHHLNWVVLNTCATCGVWTVTLPDYKEVVVTVGEKAHTENSESGATHRTEDLKDLSFSFYAEMTHVPQQIWRILFRFFIEGQQTHSEFRTWYTWSTWGFTTSVRDSVRRGKWQAWQVFIALGQETKQCNALHSPREMITTRWSWTFQSEIPSPAGQAKARLPQYQTLLRALPASILT